MSPEPPPWAGTLAERGSKVLVPAYARYALELVSGQGCRIVDSAGVARLDFVAGIAVCALGHRHPAVVEAIKHGAEGLLHASNLYWTEPQVRLAERLARASGLSRVFFCNSGTEAVEGCLKIARKARPGRPRVLSFAGSFHGRTLGALSATAQEKYQAPFRPLVPGFESLPFGDLAAVEQALGPDVAAVLVEPIQGEGGVRPQPPRFLEGLRRLCDAEGTLLILDEVQCGVGRTGRFYAYQEEAVRPDLVATAKGLGGGFPIGAVLASEEAGTVLAPGEHGSTFGGGPLACRVALAVLDVVEGEGFLDSVRLRGERLGRGLARLVERHEHAAAARGRGLMRGLVLSGPHASALVERLHERGLLTVPAGNDVIRLVPPLVVADDEVDEALAILDEALDGFAPPETH
jgi:predicted acetylornithine/succinylornithine family transaminase